MRRIGAGRRRPHAGPRRSRRRGPSRAASVSTRDSRRMYASCRPASRQPSSPSSMNGLSSLIWVTCSWMAAHLASSGAPRMSSQVVIVLVRDQHLRRELLELGDLLGRRVLGRLPEAALAELRNRSAIAVRDRRRDGLLVELGWRPRRRARLLELRRIPGGVAGAVEGADRDVVGPDVVGVAVAAERVVGRHDVRLVAAARARSADRPPRPGRPARTSAGRGCRPCPSSRSRGSRGSPTR